MGLSHLFTRLHGNKNNEKDKEKEDECRGGPGELAVGELGVKTSETHSSPSETRLALIKTGA
jgi:hypothetical protein